MKKNRFQFALIFVCTFSVLSLLTIKVFTQEKPVLNEIRVTKQNIRDSILNSLPGLDFDYLEIVQGVKFPIPLTRHFFKNPGEIPDFSQSISGAVIQSSSRLPELFHIGFQLLGAGAGGFGPPLPGTGNNVFISDEKSLLHNIKKIDFRILQEKEWIKLPFQFKKHIVECMLAFSDAKQAFDQYKSPLIPYLNKKKATRNIEIFNELIIPWQQRELTDFTSVDIIQEIDLKKLSFATRIIAEKLNAFFLMKDLEVPADFVGCNIQTDLGTITINGTKNDTLKNEPFFVVDFGGDDVYAENTASSVSLNQPFGIVIDMKGNDKYNGTDKFLAAGILGIAALIDFEGDDYYATDYPGLAFSLYGSSLLYDLSGNDIYIGKADFTQSSSFIGTSFLMDISGNDKYFCRSNSQAFGGTLGAGIFLDNAGDDRYNVKENQDTEELPSQNFIQGAARGRWAEATDGQSLAGGIGIFTDRLGTDKYNASSFSQGASYYFGMGLFNEMEGNDKYNALSHSQGYAVHYSLAGFIENKGDDDYNTKSTTDKLTQIIGGGRDLSAGIFIEMEGNDSYSFGNRSAGIADISGVGLLADFNGNDKYTWHKNRLNSGSPSLGHSIALSENMGVGFKPFKLKNTPCKGIFYDSNGDTESR
jgi:hypothetical protein